jgi:hypothetical protein
MWACCSVSFGDLGEPDMAYVEHAPGATHLEEESAVTLARLELERLRTLVRSAAAWLDFLPPSENGSSTAHDFARAR